MKSLAIVVGILSLLIFSPGTSSSYDDTNECMHQVINAEALKLFEERFFREDGYDPHLRLAYFNDTPYKGIDWSPADGVRQTGPRIAVEREKPIRKWIIEGGFSADEPEGPMALLHFYDPTNKERPWLTDQQWIVNFLKRIGGSTIDNPEIDAVTWAFKTRSEDTFEFLGLFDQEYGWIQAKEYLRKAIESDNPNELYGKAWRALGEVMHLVADMTVPAHVRNDGHASIPLIERDPDPYEKGCFGSQVKALIKEGSPADINYFRLNAESMMREVARYTNANFFSQDTIKGRYSSPGLNKLKETKTGYLYTTEDGHTYQALGKRGFVSQWWSGEPYHIDEATIKDQQKILVPTAVYAAAGVVYAFLPRFRVEAKVKPAEGSEGIYQVAGGIKLAPNLQWQREFKVRNGAFVVVEKDGKKTRIPVKRYNRDNLNEFVVEIRAPENSEIYVEYDFGGYVIRSPKEDKPKASDKVYRCIVYTEDGKKVAQFDFILAPKEVFYKTLKEYTGKVLTPEEKAQDEAAYFNMLMHRARDLERVIPKDLMPLVAKGELWVLFHGNYYEYDINGDLLSIGTYDRGFRTSFKKIKEKGPPQGTNPFANIEDKRKK